MRVLNVDGFGLFVDTETDNRSSVHTAHKLNKCYFLNHGYGCGTTETLLPPRCGFLKRLIVMVTYTKRRQGRRVGNDNGENAILCFWETN